jgi:TonB family protein
MRAFSSVVSITGHVALGAAVLLGTAKTGRSNPGGAFVPTIVFPPPVPMHGDGGPSVPGPVTIPLLDFRSLPSPATLPSTGITTQTFAPFFSSSPHSGSGSDPSTGWSVVREAQPEVLSGPLPVYPELLRQAGVQGEVLLEAVVDTTGRVLASSIVIIAATHPGFVAAARQALLATLFRPAMVGGRAVQTRVRIPYAFAIRGGRGRAR